MKSYIKLMLLVILILTVGFWSQFFKQSKPIPADNPPPKITTPAPEESWTEENLRYRKQLALEAQVSEKMILPHDIEFKKAYPKFFLVKTKFYTILTENKSFAFQNALLTLTQFQQSMRQNFSFLITKKLKKTPQVVFFDSEKSFSDFRKQMSIPSWTSGFYHFSSQRLFLYNALDTAKTIPMSGHIRIPFKYQELIFPTLTGQMDQILTTMRHEAAHQILIETGVLSSQSALWLHEGLASYCEKSQMGLAHRQYLTLLPHVPKTSMHDLMQIRSLGSNEETVAALYVRSWALVYYLMQSERRAQFINFLRAVQKDPNTSFSSQQLARYLGIEEQQLINNFENYVSQISR